MQINLKVTDKVKVWIQGQSEPVWVEILELNEQGFPIKIKTRDNRTLSRTRVHWILLVWESMLS